MIGLGFRSARPRHRQANPSGDPQVDPHSEGVTPRRATPQPPLSHPSAATADTRGRTRIRHVPLPHPRSRASKAASRAATVPTRPWAGSRRRGSLPTALVSAFTAIGATRRGYDWRHDPVSSLAIGRQGWLQRANFILAGVLYTCASRDLLRLPR